VDRVDVLIVGGGHGGAQAAIALRQQNFAGTIAIVSDDVHPPYERPPLSKAYLSGARSLEQIFIRPVTFWADRRVELFLGRRVTRVEAKEHRVVLADGSSIGYGKLIWAGGGHPRRLSCEGHELKGVHSVRCVADVDGLLADLQSASRVVLIGGGYIGLEAASALRKLDKQVVLLEALDRLLARVAGKALSSFYLAEHRAHGVDVRLGVSVAAIHGESGRAVGVRLADGTVVDAGAVVLGIGIIPSVEPLKAAGAACSNGVDVDEQCRTTLEDVFAIGDCACHTNSFADGARLRLESVQNANDQAVVVAKVIMGAPARYEAIPWFWSEQYDLKLQTVGLSTGYDTELLRGDPATRSFSVIYLKEGRVLALDCVNAPRDYVQGRALITSRVIVPREKLSDVSVALNTLAGPAANQTRPPASAVK
jgi:3-phenylpropionate/trans-cinnamate dioxygenase ferredoxin reductase subunit